MISTYLYYLQNLIYSQPSNLSTFHPYPGFRSTLLLVSGRWGTHQDFTDNQIQCRLGSKFDKPMNTNKNYDWLRVYHNKVLYIFMFLKHGFSTSRSRRSASSYICIYICFRNMLGFLLVEEAHIYVYML